MWLNDSEQLICKHTVHRLLYMCRFDCKYAGLWAPTSSLLPFWVNLKPGMRLGLHATPTSSECLQSDTPKPLDWHWARLFSAPVQCTLSNQIWPGMTRNKVGKWMQMDFLFTSKPKVVKHPGGCWNGSFNSINQGKCCLIGEGMCFCNFLHTHMVMCLFSHITCTTPRPPSPLPSAKTCLRRGSNASAGCSESS